MNRTLEEMARALFKSWFIDFDPVRAKATLKHHNANHSPLKGESARQACTSRTWFTNHSPLERESARQRVQAEHGLRITPLERESARHANHSPLEMESARHACASRTWFTNHSPLEGESARGRSPQSSRWGEMKRSYTQQTLERAKTLRQSQTDAEGLLWHYLRRKQLDGYKFRRQQPIGPYIVDFACMSRKLVIELDGGQHAERHAYDETRDDYLRGKGYRILRFWNNEVFQNCMDVLEAVYQALVSPPPHQPSFGSLATGPPPHQPSPVGSASATPPQGGSDLKACIRRSRITPPLRGSRREGGARSRAGGG